MKGYSKISVLAMTAALGTTVFFGARASAQQYSPVSVNNSVQVNWDVADGFGDQPTVPQYLSPTVSRDHIVMAGGDLIFPETRPKSAFLARDQFAENSVSGGYDGGFETVVIDGAGSANGIPSRSEFYGVPGVNASASMDDGANQIITLRQPEPTSAPRSKPVIPKAEAAAAAAATVTPAAAAATSNTPTPLAKPAPAAPTSVAAVETPAPAPMAPSAPAVPAIEPVATNNDVPPAPAPAPDTTQPAPAMAQSAPAQSAPAPIAEPAPPAEQAAVPPANTPSPAPMPASSSDEYSLGFAADSFELSEAAKGELNQLIAAMSNDDSLRIQLQAYAQGDGANASKARRLSLSRALQVRSYLIDQGVRSTRIDVRALGSNVPSGPADRVDIKTVQR